MAIPGQGMATVMAMAMGPGRRVVAMVRQDFICFVREDPTEAHVVRPHFSYRKWQWER